jgi:hypothetical protein
LLIKDGIDVETVLHIAQMPKDMVFVMECRRKKITTTRNTGMHPFKFNCTGHFTQKKNQEYNNIL